MNRTKRSLLFIVLSLLVFASVAMTSAVSAADHTSVWQGGVSDMLSGEGTEASPYLIADGDDLAYFGKCVAEGESFSGKYVKLLADIDMGADGVLVDGKLQFYPIGYDAQSSYFDSDRVFSGVFDGNGNTISNIYQNTSMMNGVYNGTDYSAAMGLFGHLKDATVKNLVIDGFTAVGEYTDIGCVAAYASGSCTFENIAVINCDIHTKEAAAAGIVGWDKGGYSASFESNFSFSNITIDSSNTIGAVEGDSGCFVGGVMGYLGTYSSSAMTNCHVASSLDVNSYADGQYLYSGMAIGTVDSHKVSADSILPNLDNVSASDCTVYLSDGAFDQLFAGYGWAVDGVSVGEFDGISVLDRNTADSVYKFSVSENVADSYLMGTVITMGELFYAVDNADVAIDYDNIQITVSPVGEGNAQASLITDASDWTQGSVALSGVGDIKITITDYYFCKNTSVIISVVEPDPVVKFEGTDKTVLIGTTLKVSDIFAAIADADIDTDNITITVTTVDGENVATIGDADVWSEKTLSFGGVGVYEFSITDNDYCIATTATVTVYEPDPVVKFAGEDKTVIIGTTIKVGEILFAKADVDIDTDNITITAATVEGDGTATVGDADIWSNKVLSFSGVGKYEITITDNDYCTPTTATVTVYEPDPVVKFDVKLPNVDKYLYRVGNGNTVALGTLFTAVNGTSIDASGLSVTIEAVDGGMSVGGTFTSNSDWTKATVKMNGTGVVKLTITDNDYCIATVLYLEVVNGNNITSASGSIDGTDVVLMSNVKVASGGNANYFNCTVYGNGFTFDVSGGMNMYNSKQGHGIIIIKNATLDNIVIIGDVYDTYGAYSTQEDYTAAIDATGSIIQNCYIANCATPIRGNGVTLTDTTLYGGTVANLILSGSTNTLSNVVTVNYNDGRGILGLGILISDGAADNTKLVLNGTLKQYNYICENDISAVPGEYAPQIFNVMFEDTYSAYHINHNGAVYVNTGIISMNADFNSDDITDNASTGYIAKDDVQMTLKDGLLSTTVDGALYTAPSGTTVDNGYTSGNDTHSSTVQGDYLPTPEFALGDQTLAKDGDDDTRYIIGDINGIEALYQSGDAPLTLDLTKLMKVYKYSGIYYTVSAVCKDENGNALTATNGVVTLSESGNYTLVFTVDDNIFYGPDGSKTAKSVTRTYEVPLTLSVKQAAIPDATITVSSSDITGDYVSSGTDKKYKFYPMKAITSITDAGNSFSFKSNIASTSISYSSTDNAFAGSTTITVTYTTGQVLTITLGTPSGLNSPSASNGGKTLGITTDSTNGIVVTSDGKIGSSSAVTGTWPITGWSFKGENQSTVTNSTKVNIAFTKPESCITPDTLVMLADGTEKRVDALTGEEMLLVWNHETGRMDVAPIAYIVNHDREMAEHEVIYLYFSDGKTIKIIGEHVFYNATLGKYMPLDTNAEEYIGHKFLVLSDDASGVAAAELVKVEKQVVLTEAYEVVSYKHLTCFTDGILSTSAYLDKLLNVFDIDKDSYSYTPDKIAEDIATYGLYTYADFEDIITEEAFELYNAAYLKIAVGKGYITWDDILELVDIYFNVGVTPIQ